METPESSQIALPLGKSETPFEAAATMFGLYAPKFEELVKGLSTGELRRLVNGLVQYPISSKDFISESERVRTAFSLGQTLLEAKWVMVMQSMMDHEKEFTEETGSSGKAEVVSEENPQNETVENKENENV